MPNLDAILPIIPRDVRVGVVREHERVEQVEKDSALRALQEEEQNSLQQRQQQSKQQPKQQPKQEQQTAEQQAPAEEQPSSDADDKPSPGTHLDTYA